MSDGMAARNTGEKPRSHGRPEVLLPCDIVMAGGVTSGIIYPGAVSMIARRFSFHSIGGTSVGAIAAAVTAAAEYGRRSGRNPSAFDQVASISKSLGEAAPDGRSRLFHLFTPEDDTRGLLALLSSSTDGSPQGCFVGVSRSAPAACGSGAGARLFVALCHLRCRLRLSARCFRGGVPRTVARAGS
jgi:hypothetical protein